MPRTFFPSRRYATGGKRGFGGPSPLNHPFFKQFLRNSGITRAKGMSSILVVEDELIVAEHLRSRLSAMGYTVPMTAISGEEAIAMAAELLPDVVLMDIRLGGAIDGIMAAHTIRSQWGIPIIYLTAYVDEETVQRAKQTEPYGYLLKPFDSRELQITIDMAIYRHRAERERAELLDRLETALASIKTLRGLIPICASCKKIRDDEGYWMALELYLKEHTEANFSHGICPDCAHRLYGEIFTDV